MPLGVGGVEQTSQTAGHLPPGRSLRARARVDLRFAPGGKDELRIIIARRSQVRRTRMFTNSLFRSLKDEGQMRPGVGKPGARSPREESARLIAIALANVQRPPVSSWANIGGMSSQPE